MGTGPHGSGVTITKAAEFNDDRSPQERALDARRDRARRLAEHRAREDAFQKALRPDLEDKQLDGPPENKGADPEELSRDELEAAARERGVTVTRADGRTDLGPTKSDYVRALSE